MSSQAVPAPIVIEAPSSRVELSEGVQRTTVQPAHQIVGVNLPLEINIPQFQELETNAVDGSRDVTESEVLPPYIEELPAYSSMGSNEPVTLAMYLFKFGFLFPPFWIMGAMILLSPLREPEPSPSFVWLPEKTESERQEIVQKMRATEVKWAKRCLLALSVLLLLGAVVGLMLWGILKHH